MLRSQIVSQTTTRATGSIVSSGGWNRVVSRSSISSCFVKPRICSSHLLRLVNPCCNACLLLWNPRASHGVAKGNYRHFCASLVSPSGWNKTTRCTCSRLRHNFAPQHNYYYACVTKSLQLRVSLRFTAPRYDAYCKLWVYSKLNLFLFFPRPVLWRIRVMMQPTKKIPAPDKSRISR